MLHRVNVMMDDEAWKALQRVPRGRRSRFVNAAIQDRVRREKRREAAARMDALRKRLPAVGTAEIVRWIREDRERGSSR